LDLHQTRNEWGNSIFPMVPGHEIICRVVSVGKEVARFKTGDHVGVGCLVDSCQLSATCEQGTVTVLRRARDTHQRPLPQTYEAMLDISKNSYYEVCRCSHFNGYISALSWVPLD